VQTREGNHVDSQLAQVRVKLTRESKASGDTGHDGGDEVVQITVGGVGELEGAHADIVESLYKSVRAQTPVLEATNLVVNTESLIGVLNELVNGKGGVVRLNNGVGDLGRGNDGESSHHAVGELLTNLGDQESTHTGTGTTTERVGDLETLEAVATLSLATDNIDDVVDKLSTLSVVTLGPVVTSAGLAENEVVGTEELAEGTGADGIHSTGLEIDEDGTRNVLVTAGLDEVRHTPTVT
jgi:hypothetical protein